MKIRIDILQFVQARITSTPLNLPNRNQYLITEIQKYCEAYQETHNYVSIDLISPFLYFEHSEEVIIFLVNKLPRNCFDVERQLFGLSVFAPKDTSCCKGFRIDPRPSLMTVYDIHRVYDALNYHGICKGCKKIYYPCYVDHGLQRVFRMHDQIFHFTSTTAFTTKLLKHFSLQLTVGFISFEKAATIYNEEVTSEKTLNADIIEEMFFIYKVSEFNQNLRWHRKKNSHVNLEKICEENYEEIAKAVELKWVDHVCDDIGCSNRVIVCDGNEKLYRYICSKEIECIPSAPGVVAKKKRCVRNPVRGNQNLQNKKLCEHHSTQSLNDHDDDKNVRIDFHPFTRSYVKKLEEVIVSGEGCKTESNVNKFSERTAGMFYLFRPCGVRIAHREMLTAESLSLVFSTFFDIFTLSPAKDLIRTIIYDRACDLHPYLIRLAKEGNEAARHFAELNFIVDIFHAEKHTMPKCTIISPECKYHPDLPQYSYIRGANTEICEQSFHLLNPCKHITRNMTYAKRLCLLKFIDDDFNTRLVKNT